MNAFLFGALLAFAGLTLLMVTEDYSRKLSPPEACGAVMVYSGSAIVAISSYIFIISLL